MTLREEYNKAWEEREWEEIRRLFILLVRAEKGEDYELMESLPKGDRNSTVITNTFKNGDLC